MADNIGGFESRDVLGTTTVIVGTATVTPTDYPTVSAGCISEFYIENMDSSSKELEISLDGGTVYKKIKADSFWAWSIKGEATTQLKIRRVTTDVAFELVVNREPV